MTLRGRLLLVGGLLITCAVTAQAQAGSRRQPSTAPDGVYLWNSNQIDGVYFAICGDTCTPVNDRLPPNSSNIYRCARAGVFKIVVSTGQTDGKVKTKERLLAVGRRYKLYYNLTDRAWDVAQLK